MSNNIFTFATFVGNKNVHSPHLKRYVLRLKTYVLMLKMYVLGQKKTTLYYLCMCSVFDYYTIILIHSKILKQALFCISRNYETRKWSPFAGPYFRLLYLLPTKCALLKNIYIWVSEWELLWYRDYICLTNTIFPYYWIQVQKEE